MRTEQRTIYIAKDNSEHKTEIEALAREAAQDLQIWCDKHIMRGSDGDDVSESLVDNIESLAPLVQAVYKTKLDQKRLAASGRG